MNQYITLKDKETGEEKTFKSKLAAFYAIADLLKRNGITGDEFDSNITEAVEYINKVTEACRLQIVTELYTLGREEIQ